MLCSVLRRLWPVLLVSEVSPCSANFRSVRRPMSLLLFVAALLLLCCCPAASAYPGTFQELDKDYRCVKLDAKKVADTMLDNVMHMDGGRVGFKPKPDSVTPRTDFEALTTDNSELKFEYILDEPNKCRPEHYETIKSASHPNCKSRGVPDENRGKKIIRMECTNWKNFVRNVKGLDKFYYTIGDIWAEEGYKNFTCKWRARFSKGYRLLVKKADLGDDETGTETIKECTGQSIPSSETLPSETSSSDSESAPASAGECLFGSSPFLVMFILAFLLLFALIGLAIYTFMWRRKQIEELKKLKAAKRNNFSRHDWNRTKNISEIHKPARKHERSMEAGLPEQSKFHSASKTHKSKKSSMIDSITQWSSIFSKSKGHGKTKSKHISRVSKSRSRQSMKPTVSRNKSSKNRHTGSTKPTKSKGPPMGRSGARSSKGITVPDTNESITR